MALVTGASHPNDIGSAICRKLASEAKDIFFTHWGAIADWGKTFTQEILDMGVRCGCISIDLADPNAAFQVLDAVTNQLGFPTILVNNAAHSTRDGYMVLDAETLDAHYAVNMRSTFLLCAEFARRFKNSQLKSGSIVNMTSGQDLGAMVGELAYVATKVAISAFTKTLSVEVAPLGVTVNAVNPGSTDSTWMTDEIRRDLLPKYPMGRIGLPEDVARLVGFLTSDDARWITGQVINSEGGFYRS
ncbi:SDR family oxidoreductase [Camelliibacillus cellulosilyticus]|uniref:SDR family oxidoreductase n=1 Tax=Camelliibacillus cellulosilyticus TaxID=2174486 RepID=A0ABV9GNK7_9BACL